MSSYKFVPHAPDGQQALGILGIIAELLAQTVDMDMERLQFRIAVAAPDRVEKVLLFECFALIFDQQREQFKFLCREIYLPAVDLRGFADQIQHDAVGGEHIPLIPPLENPLDLCNQNVDFLVFDIFLTNSLFWWIMVKESLNLRIYGNFFYDLMYDLISSGYFQGI